MKLRLLLVLLGTLVWPAVAQARPAPVTWCGTDEVSADRTPNLEVSAPQQIRFVYVTPSDGPDNFLASASGIATDAAWIDQWWQGQDASRTPRFDRYPFPGCTSTFGELDIGFLRLAQPTSQFEAMQDPSLGLDPVLAGKFPSTQKTIVYYDGKIDNGRLCGETDYLSDTTGGDQGLVYVYLQGGCDLGPPGNGGTAEVAAHELTHNLGAVPGGAPHECPDNSNHACDSPTDLMYPYLQPGATLDAVTLDVGRDDYYGEGGTLWNVQTSGWLEHLPQFGFSLSVGAGGTVSARAGLSNLPCDTGCTGLQLDNGAEVSLNAVPAPGFAFAGWSGSCGGSARLCTVATTGDTTVTAAFVRAPLKVSVSISGKGTVGAPGLTCASSCTKTFAGTSVRFAAKPASGWKFKGWSGACSGTGSCTVDAAGALRATFVRRSL